MKTLKYFLIMVLAGVAFSACTEDKDNPPFAYDEVYVYDSASGSLAAIVGEEFVKEIVVSPNDGSVQCCWMLGFTEGDMVYKTAISTERDLRYTFKKTGSYKLYFTATRGGRTVTKNYNLDVVNQ